LLLIHGEPEERGQDPRIRVSGFRYQELSDLNITRTFYLFMLNSL
jgi:hypothetical protein